MRKWLLWVLLILLLAIPTMHFIHPRAMPDRLAIPILAAAIAVMFVFTQIGRRKELEQIRGELRELHQELKDLKSKQQR